MPSSCARLHPAPPPRRRRPAPSPRPDATQACCQARGDRPRGDWPRLAFAKGGCAPLSWPAFRRCPLADSPERCRGPLRPTVAAERPGLVSPSARAAAASCRDCLMSERAETRTYTYAHPHAQAHGRARSRTRARARERSIFTNIYARARARAHTHTHTVKLTRARVCNELIYSAVCTSTLVAGGGRRRRGVIASRKFCTVGLHVMHARTHARAHARTFSHAPKRTYAHAHARTPARA